MRIDKNALRILLIAPQPFYEDRGSPVAILEELKALNEIGYLVDLATYPIGANVKISGVKIIRSANLLGFRYIPIGFSFRKVLLDLFLFLTVLRLAYKKHYDCIHGVEEGAAMALICKILFGVQIIYDMHSSIPEQICTVKVFKNNVIKKITLFFEKYLIKKADAILASAGLSPHVLSVVSGKPVWECSFSGYEPKPRNEALARRLGVLKSPTVVYAGNFSSYQGLDLLIEAAVIVRSKIPEVVFLLIGGTKFDIPPIAQLVTRYKLEGTVQLHHRVPRDEVAEYLALADALILPRKKGINVPLKLFDYMKSNKPIVATAIQAHIAILTHKTAQLVKPEAEMLADGLLRVIRDKGLASMLALEADKSVRSLKKKSLHKTLTEIYTFVLES